MATDTTLLENLSAITESLNSATDGIQSTKSLAPPNEGLSLLDTKNELLLSYLQNLVFLILYKLRNHRTPPEINSPDADPSHIDIVKNLVSLRLYLEKGVRPLETRLKYQLDKLLLAASEADTQTAPPPPSRKAHPTMDTASVSGESSSDDHEPTAPTISDLSHRPDLSAFTRPRHSSPPSSSKRDANVYRPPRITPTALPTTSGPSKDAHRKRKNNMLDAFVREELSTAPVAEPSIGAGNGLRGRDAEKERERKEYEELRLVRLPMEGKKKGKGRKERIGGGFEEVLGGAGEGLGDAVRGGGKRRKVAGGVGGEGRKVGEAWEKRKKMGVRGLGGKRR
ncbi:MAG: hypothetical protein LQ339_002091 [Xanthoria mediterranea]|nr:MAG: hypothetical protein LQ339_002091 [Xanthoria mediterranea]